VTAIETVFGIIKVSENGINTADLMTKTGFNTKNVQNLVAKLKKKGQIITVGRGVYGIV
jgi:predicted transcriptional regulator